MKQIPDLSGPRSVRPFGMDLSVFEGLSGNYVLNEQYYRELANYEFVRRLFRFVRLVVTNKGKVAANNVRVELTIRKGEGVGISDSCDIPEPPKRRTSRYCVPAAMKHIRPAIRHVADVFIDANNDRFKVEMECGNLQPGPNRRRPTTPTARQDVSGGIA